MANQQHPQHQQQDNLGDDFLEEILAMPGYDAGDGGSGAARAAGIGLQLSSADGALGGGGAAAFHDSMFPLGLSLEQASGARFPAMEEGSGSGKRFRDDPEERDPVQLSSLFPAFGHILGQQIRPSPPHHPLPQTFHGQAQSRGGGVATTAPQPPAPRPRVRARRGQATDPHSIAERQRRERIAERMRSLQELLPNSNKTDRAAMLDEILDYVKFLRLQVKVLSMSRLGGAGAVAQLVADIPLSLVEGDTSEEGGSKQEVWERWSSDGTERRVAKLMEDDIGAAMQFLQSKSLCIMPISLASAIYHPHFQPGGALQLPSPDPDLPHESNPSR